MGNCLLHPASELTMGNSGIEANTAQISDVEKRLPPKSVLDAILDSSSLHGIPLSERDLYMQLCKSISYDNNLKRFWLDHTTGADCYMISARALSIAWGDTPQYWKWQSWPGAMFSEVAYLQSVCWFDVSGKFQQKLRPGKYMVSFRIQLISPEAGWQRSPIKLSLQNVSYAHSSHLSQVYFDGTTTFKRRYCPLPDTSLAPQTLPTVRIEFVWIECDVGEFLVEDDNGGGRPVEIHFSMREIEVLRWKGGFVLDGVIIRPSLLAESVTME